ncbi:hypothetical protein BW730_04260 [Tessaracoccus aquimaris]|uniref:Uncharacterized protein n=1 Tax=Tessaracoccus aquimaris TaxID=1332264 RepID=A0A1Q2CL62_9ACTN|nr:hypothetical protein BW730_04260 [Tessaracoccus aquimaris]
MEVRAEPDSVRECEALEFGAHIGERAVVKCCDDKKACADRVRKSFCSEFDTKIMALHIVYQESDVLWPVEALTPTVGLH